MKYTSRYSGIAYRRLKHSHQLRAMMKRRDRHAASVPFSRKHSAVKGGEEAR